MAQRDPPVEEGTIEERRAHLGVMLNRFIGEIEGAIAQVEGGDFSDLNALPRIRRDLVSTAKQLRDAEIEIDAQRKRDKGGVPGAGEPFNLADARASIGGRLDKLRAALGAGELS